MAKNEPMKKAVSLMIQGTTSDAGKSILVTALCRLFARKGFRVMPFKAQNMALNSAVTASGGEIGRAQAVQAEAAGVPPTELMNPVLLKPNSDLGAQVIVNGKAIGNMKADVYHRYKPQLLKEVVEAYETLARSADLIFIEGAGSPAEINLRDRDIVNMGLAEAIDCPVVIVADIDRGGVFAHLVGTYELLSESEQKRVVGFIINRFRGDLSLLQPGIDWLEKRLNVPVLAVIPYIEKLYIEAEDAINFHQAEAVKLQLSVKVISYPRMSNHTDFDALRVHPGVDCQFIRSSHELEGADVVILPGSKNVRGDLDWLQQGGFESKLKTHLRYGGQILGICGGYQMLGEWIHDPDEVESAAGSSKALGLLAMETTLKADKTLKNVEGFIQSTEAAIKGYEIHAGVTSGEALTRPLFTLKKAEGQLVSEGASDAEGAVRGTYLHGLFDTANGLDDFINWTAFHDEHISLDMDSFKQQEYERLADAFEAAWQPDSILTLMREFGE